MISEQEPSTYRPLIFSVVEDAGENVTVEISDEDSRRDLAAGIDQEATLKPGRYKMKRWFPRSPSRVETSGLLKK